MHSQTDCAISQSRIATIFSMEAFGRDASTRDSHNYNNSTALSQSVANDSVSLDSIGASVIVRITNRRASMNRGGPGIGGDSEATCMLQDVGVSNALQRAIFVGLSGSPACRTESSRVPGYPRVERANSCPARLPPVLVALSGGVSSQYS